MQRYRGRIHVGDYVKSLKNNSLKKKRLKLTHSLRETCKRELGMRHAEERPVRLDSRQDSVWKAA